MTPEAVIFRYLEAADRQPLSVESFIRVLSADADLLGRWLNLTDLGVDPRALTRSVAALPSDEVHSLAQAQAWAVLPIAGSARLGLDQWRAVLHSSFVAELLAERLELDDASVVRWRVLLAVSGVSLARDPELVELGAFRGASAELLVDASPLVRIFAVVDAREVVDEYQAAELAATLLGLEADAFSEIVEAADGRCTELIESLNLDADPDADWSHRLWMQQQVSMLSGLLAQAESHDDIQVAHELVARSLFREVPLLLIDAGAGRYRSTLVPDVVIHADSTASEIAATIRDGGGRAIAEHGGLSVGDRQLLRRMKTTEAACIPVRMNGHVSAILLMNMDEDVDDDFALSLYVVALGQRLANPGAAGEDALELVRRYRQREERRMRELVHEANNPLSVVQNYLHILQMRLQHEDTAAEQLSMIGTELHRVTEIIQRARELPPISELDRDAEVVSAEFDVNDLVRRVHELHLGYAADHNVTLSTQIQPGAVMVQTDGQRLAQVLNNLVRNGIEAAAGERVTIGLDTGVFREGREGIEVYVTDSGPGLPRSVLERLAEPKETTKGGEHAGLGLHIVYRLIAELGGNIDVRTAVSKGTSFSLFLPLRP